MPGRATFRLSTADVTFVTVKAQEVENDILPILLVDADATGSGSGSTWADAFTGLRAVLAVAAATPGSVSEIWVAEGTYTPAEPGGDRSATLHLLSGLGVYGGFTGLETERDQRHPALFEHTILSGDLNGDDLPGFVNNQENSYHVVTGSGTDQTAVLDGFAITAGNTDLPWRQDPQGGAGMYNDGGSPTVANCTFQGNRAKWGGGMYNYESDPAVTTCTFTNNAGWFGAGMFNQDGSPTLTDCVFYKNFATYDGGALYNYDLSAPLLIHCTFRANSGEWGGAVANQSDCEPTLTDCLFVNNSADMGGGLINFAGSPILVGCSFTGNSALGSGYSPAYGGGMFDTEGASTLIRCTFSGNHAKEGGGGVYAEEDCGAWLMDCVFTDNTADWVGGAMYNHLGSLATLTNCTLTGNQADLLCGGIFNSFDSAPTVTNCILWNNRGPPSLRGGRDTGSTGRDSPTEGEQIDGGSPVVTFTCIQGLDALAGNGNIGDDPLFRADGLHLRRRSPCRNAGDPAFVPFEGQTDIDGNPRVLDGRVDTGADEVPLDLATPISADPLEPAGRPLR